MTLTTAGSSSGIAAQFALFGGEGVGGVGVRE